MKDDSINRRSAVDAVLGVIPYDEYWLEQVNKAIEALPSADAAPVVHGRWKAVTEDMVTYKRICSCCGKEAPYDMRDEDPLSEGYYMLYPYCPWCGAKMDGKDGDHHE